MRNFYLQTLYVSIKLDMRRMKLCIPITLLVLLSLTGCATSGNDSSEKSENSTAEQIPDEIITVEQIPAKIISVSNNIETSVNNNYKDTEFELVKYHRHYLDTWSKALQAGIQITRFNDEGEDFLYHENDKIYWPGWARYYDAKFNNSNYCLVDIEMIAQDEISELQYKSSLESPQEYLAKTGGCAEVFERYLAYYKLPSPKMSNLAQSEEVFIKYENKQELYTKLTSDLAIAVNKYLLDENLNTPEGNFISHMEPWLTANFNGISIKRFINETYDLFPYGLSEGDKDIWPGFAYYFEIRDEQGINCIANMGALIANELTEEELKRTKQFPPEEFKLKEGDCQKYYDQKYAEYQQSKKNTEVKKVDDSWVPKDFVRVNDVFAYKWGNNPSESEIQFEIYSKKNCDVLVILDLLDGQSTRIGNVFPLGIIAQANKKVVVVEDISGYINIFPGTAQIAISDIKCN